MKDNNIERSSNLSTISATTQQRKKCLLHGRKYLTLSSSKKSVICKKCQKDNLDPTNFTYEDVSSDTSTPFDFINDKSLQCIHKCGNPTNYYCYFCKGFLCYNCLIANHISHDIDSIAYIANAFRDDVSEKEEKLSSIVKNINSELNSIRPKEKKKDSNEENKKELLSQSLSQIENVKKNITSSLNKTLSSYESNFNSIFDNNDNEVQSLSTDIAKTTSNIDNAMSVISSMLSTLNSTKLNCDAKCEAFSKQAPIIQKTKDIIKHINHVMNKTTMTKYKYTSTKEEINSKIESLNKNVSATADTLSFSIQNGSDSKSYHLNRFKTFQHSSMKYFKTTSVIVSSLNSISIIGVNICSVYIHKSKLVNPEYNTIEKRDFVPIQISISKYFDDHCETLLSEEKKLIGAVNNNDPVISIFLSKGISVKENEKILITIENLNKEDYYGDFWIGSTSTQCANERVQRMICNSTGIKAVFEAANGIQSDFDEFAAGLIEGIIFTCEQ